MVSERRREGLLDTGMTGEDRERNRFGREDLMINKTQS